MGSFFSHSLIYYKIYNIKFSQNLIWIISALCLSFYIMLLIKKIKINHLVIIHLYQSINKCWNISLSVCYFNSNWYNTFLSHWVSVKQWLWNEVIHDTTHVQIPPKKKLQTHYMAAAGGWDSIKLQMMPSGCDKLRETRALKMKRDGKGLLRLEVTKIVTTHWAESGSIWAKS